MGLSLRSPSESDFLPNSNLDGGHRYLPGRPATEGLNPHAKHHRRPLGWSTWKLECAQREGESALVEVHGPLRGSLPEDYPRENRHFVHLARTNLRLNRQYDRYCRDPSRISRKHVTRRHRQVYADSVDGGWALARSRLVLPGEDSQEKLLEQQSRGRSRSGSRSRSSSPPSLDRQDAFRDPFTTKKRNYRTMASPAVLMDTDEMEVEQLYSLGLLYDNDGEEDEDVKELYRMGLLYDDEHERGSGFTFDAIVHDEPVYTLNTRPMKRGRKSNRSGQPAVTTKDDQGGMEFDLPLDLSYAALSEDAELAAFLTSVVEFDTAATTTKKRRMKSPERENGLQHMTVIYELEDDDYSQEDTTDEESWSGGFNNRRKEDEDFLEEDEGEGEEPWAFVNDNNSEFNESDNDERCDAVGTSMTNHGAQEETWVHVQGPSNVTSIPGRKGTEASRLETKK